MFNTWSYIVRNSFGLAFNIFVISIRRGCLEVKHFGEEETNSRLFFLWTQRDELGQRCRCMEIRHDSETATTGFHVRQDVNYSSKIGLHVLSEKFWSNN